MPSLSGCCILREREREREMSVFAPTMKKIKVDEKSVQLLLASVRELVSALL